MKIKENTTIVDTAFNLYGSLTGIPAILRQLPVSERIGFDILPEMGEDVADIGQTWTPDLAGKDVDIKVDKIYNTLGVAKAPYSTDLYRIGAAVRYGEELIETFLPPDTTEYENMYPMNLNGWTPYIASSTYKASIVNDYLRISFPGIAQNYEGAGYFKNVINARAGKPYKYSFDIRAGRPILISGGEFFSLTASGNYAYYPLPIRIDVQPGDVFTVSVEDINVLAGNPTGFTAIIYDETTEISNRVVLTRTNRTATLTIKAGLEEIINPKLFVYAGIVGQTAGNKVEFTDVRMYDPAAPAPTQAIVGLTVSGAPVNPSYYNIISDIHTAFKHYEFEFPTMDVIRSNFWISQLYNANVAGFFEVRNIKVTQYI